MTTPLNSSIPYGLCQCGCGHTAPLQRDNDKTKGYVKGQPHAFLVGHASRIRVSPDQCIRVEVDGAYCRQIPLTRGQFALVDEDDFPLVGRFKWNARWSECSQSFYAMRKGPKVNGKQTTLLMHREILGLTRGDGKEGDHVEPDQTLDNRRKNLRVTVHSGNMQNRTKLRTNKSGFKGVYFISERNRFRVTIRNNGTIIHVGYFREAEAGHRAYCLKAQQLHGQFARG